MSWHDYVVWDMPVIECEDDCFGKKHRFSVWARTVFNMNQVKGLQLATCR